MLLAVDFDEYFINVKGGSTGPNSNALLNGSNPFPFYTPEADRLSGNSDASLGQQVFDIAVTQIEAIVEPDGVGDDVRWKSVPLVSIHGPSVSISAR